ncbi:FtsQ-type POTRA domain-containing protein [Halanaerocella petrolearia]
MDKQVILICIALLVVLGVVHIIYSNYFQITEIKITGNQLLTDNYLLNFSKLQQETNIFEIDSKKIKKKLLKLPQLKSVTIKRDLPNKLVISVQERRPIAIIPFQSSYQVVDTEGWILEVTNSLSSWKLPLITGVNIDSQAKKIKLTGMKSQAVNYLSKLSKNVLAGISELHIDSQQRINLFLRQGGKVKLGTNFNIEQKAEVFTSIYQDIKTKNLKVDYVDLRYKKNSFLKLR